LTTTPASEVPPVAVAGAPAGNDLDSYMQETARLVDQEIQAVLDSGVDDSWMRGAIEYHFGWADAGFAPLPLDQRASGGKKLRSALVLLSYQGAMTTRAGGSNGHLDLVATENAMPFAAAVELVHNFSLVHDDIEDGDQTRRGRPTLWSLCGQPQAINVGDALHALAYACIARLKEHGVDDGGWAALIAALARTVVEMTIGQRRDMSYETTVEINMDMYLQMIAGKTAGVIACATFGGALLALGDADPLARNALAGYREFGRQLGLGFQIRDDVLGIWGVESDTGKSARKDIRRRKKSFPIVFAFGAVSTIEREHLQQLYATTSELSEDNEGEVRQILDGCRAAEYAQSRVELHAERARSALSEAAGGADAVGDNPYLSALEELTDQLTSRRR
jgi:geranylgeranyl diphosphate synthase type I